MGEIMAFAAAMRRAGNLALGLLVGFSVVIVAVVLALILMSAEAG
jgi:hypothetical protein